MSDCGQFGLTIIAFIGSVFSPYYAWAGRRDPQNHVALNVAVYRPNGHHWAMTERNRNVLARTSASLQIGPSALTWTEAGLTIHFDEIALPRPPDNWWPKRLRGSVRFVPETAVASGIPLDMNERHAWRPIAPRGRIALDLMGPVAQTWTGEGYLDQNWGSEPLETGFARWDWARTHREDGSTVILYDIIRRDGSAVRHGLHFGRDGDLSRFDLPPSQTLRRGFWGVTRRVPCDDGEEAAIVQTLEDSPFYTRSLVDTTVGGIRSRSMHESLSADRFASPIVKAMLPFRMPRRAGR